MLITGEVCVTQSTLVDLLCKVRQTMDLQNMVVAESFPVRGLKKIHTSSKVSPARFLRFLNFPLLYFKQIEKGT